VSDRLVTVHLHILGCFRKIAIPQLHVRHEQTNSVITDLTLRVLDCTVTISFGVYLVLWLFELVL